ncbi:hypothetical protein ABB37_00740 [Leptomonas pyrrhocoris]|uniref:PSP1 C-terminal domain-containing protein n=1 Tax=Leptomonas pyrrhocoris TaxID=157538 RepID=A0A0N0VHW3_LEPPY|nr:hypothetical protein ABB37_00740 [Leptomonas pyrrhocoris]KPA86634.1 hypothetical protein ABB37_00740 [Leptomonas pyrrhocoris]|eukprot:XP_015665073.1 hypothetical protein ABB37_00740 [Leptomonas pyrrhocoris]
MMMSPMMAKSPMSANSSQTSVPSSLSGQVRVYRHEPYAASLITPASPADAAFVCCHTRAAKSPPSIWNLPSPARSISDSALSSGGISDYSPVSSALFVPKAPATFSPQTPVWIAFKYGRKPFRASFALHAGDKVVVEGDRGVDLGIVGDACLMQGGPRPQTVLRRASAEDEAKHAERSLKEQEALRTMRTLAAQVDCPAHVEDAMFQLDGKKITVIISRTTRSFVDFRRLQRALFDVYRCRIWFAYLDEIQETMSTDVTQPLHRGQRNRSFLDDASAKKTRHGSVTSLDIQA